MEVRAKLRYLRISPRKVRAVLDVIRGMDVGAALDELHAINKKAAHPVIKLLNSAVANAEHNFKLNAGQLFIKTIFADGGATLKRWMPRAFGRAAMIRKRTSHITIVLDEAKKGRIEEKKKKLKLGIVKKAPEALSGKAAKKISQITKKDA